MILTILIAIIPTIFLGYFVYKKDILEKEPLYLLLKLFSCGILITVPASLIQHFLINIIPVINNNIIYNFVLSFIIIALTEEGLKYLVTYEITWKNKNFNHIYDGIVYSVFTSLGFATLENFLYVRQYATDFGLLKIGILRAVLSVPGHVFFAVAMGYYLGFAKYCEKRNMPSGAKRNKKLALLTSIIFHGLFDFLLLTNNRLMGIIFYIFVVVLYIISYLKIKKMSNIKTMLEGE